MEWKYGCSNCISIKDLKNSYPVELADYSIKHNINDNTDFSCWVPNVRNKMTAIIVNVNSKYWQRMHKYGIKIPKYVNEAYRIVTKNKK